MNIVMIPNKIKDSTLTAGKKPDTNCKGLIEANTIEGLRSLKGLKGLKLIQLRLNSLTLNTIQVKYLVIFCLLY